jgi:hypothetical protein
MGKSAFARGPRDLRSVTLQERLRAKWRDEIRRRPPAEREKWLKTQEAIVALSARVCRELIRAIRDQHDYVAGKVCSKPWIDAWDREELSSPACDREHQRGRSYSARMVLSKGETRIGPYGPLCRRFTPPQAVDVEDRLDSMSPARAEFYTFVESPSAKVIEKIGQLRAKETHSVPQSPRQRNYRRGRGRMDTWAVFRFEL